MNTKLFIRKLEEYCAKHHIAPDIIDVFKDMCENTKKNSLISDEFFFNMCFDLNVIKYREQDYIIDRILNSVQEFDTYVVELMFKVKSLKKTNTDDDEIFVAK